MVIFRTVLRSIPPVRTWINGHGGLNHFIRSMSTFNGLYNSGSGRTNSVMSERKYGLQKMTMGTRDDDTDRSSGDFMKGEVSFHLATFFSALNCIILILVQILDYAIDLRTQSRPGKDIASPYEITLTESLHEFWLSSFHSQDRIHTSTPFARALGLQDRVMPFSLVL